jgi:hypothetical protein
MRMLKDSSGGHFVAQGETHGGNYEDVAGDGLSGIIATVGLGAEQIALVWADVQGCEADVIESGGQLWAHGVPLWAEIEPRSLLRQGTLEAFTETVAAHFDRFIDARELIRQGARIAPKPIREFGALVHGITPQQINTDVLLLPRKWFVRPAGSRSASSPHPVS